MYPQMNKLNVFKANKANNLPGGQEIVGQH